MVALSHTIQDTVLASMSVAGLNNSLKWLHKAWAWQWLIVNEVKMLELSWQKIGEMFRKLSVMKILEWLRYLGLLTMSPEKQQRKTPSLNQ